MIVTNIKESDKQSSIIKSLTNLPPISSYSCYSDHTVLITTNNDIYGLGSNSYHEIIGSLPETKLTEFTRFYIKDKKGQILNPISAFCSKCNTLYMVSQSKDSDKNFLGYSGNHVHTEHPYFYDMNDLNPVAIFGCDIGCFFWAIDDEGSIIFIPSFSIGEDYKLEATPLPDGEKACNIAFGSDYSFVLTLSGRVLMVKDNLDKKNLMTATFIKYCSFDGLKIANISGINTNC